MNTRPMPGVAFPFLALTLLIAGTVNLPQMVAAGPVSGGGVLSILLCGGAWLLWLARPTLQRDHVPLLLPLIFFCILAVGSIAWFVASVKGLQLLCVLAGFSASSCSPPVRWRTTHPSQSAFTACWTLPPGLPPPSTPARSSATASGPST